MPPPPRGNAKINDQYRIPLPKNFKDVPRYIKDVYTSTTARMFYILKLVWEANPGILFMLAFMSIFNGVAPAIGSLLGAEILNNLSRGYNGELDSFDIIAFLLVLQAVYLLIRSVLTRVNATISRISGTMIENHIKIKIMVKAKDIDLSSYDSPDYYSKLENATREAANRPIEALNAVFSVLSTVISIVTYMIIITSIGIMPAIMVIAVAIPSTVINFYFRKKNYLYMYRRSKERRQMNYFSQLVVNKDLVKEIKILGLSDTFVDKYQSVYDEYFKGLKKLIYNECMWNIGAIVASAVVNCVLFVYIAQGVFNGEYEVGNFALYTGALNSIATGIGTLITTSASIYECTLFISNMMEFMEEKQQIMPTIDPPRQVVKGVDHTIVFENVSFRYPLAEKDTLTNINLEINPRESIVIVGLNGAGKTTLIKLLTRLYDPTSGRILLDGHDMREYDVSQLYSLFGIVFQDYGKYAATIRENIAFGEILRDIVDDDIVQAGKASNSHEYVTKLPDQYDTILTRYFEDSGKELSTGQWQKLAIARAFYSESDVLILDEPTASLDPMAEQEIFDQFDALCDKKTSIFVSHRLSSATSADKIVVMKYGEIIEIGNHSKLMDDKGEYYTFFSTQAKRYSDNFVTEQVEKFERDGREVRPNKHPFGEGGPPRRRGEEGGPHKRPFGEGGPPPRRGEEGRPHKRPFGEGGPPRHGGGDGRPPRHDRDDLPPEKD